MTEIMSQLKESLSTCDESGSTDAVQKLLNAGVPASEVIAACNEGMGKLGERFDAGDAFIPDLMFGGMIMKKIMTTLEQLPGAGEQTPVGKTIVLGTVQHDVHDIGKDITAMVFRGNGFHVVDLGVNVSPKQFVEAILAHKPEFVGLSLLLTTCYKSVMLTMEAIANAGLRENVKICVGGAAASDMVAERCGIDHYAKTAIDGLNWAKQFSV
ncbi:MAG: cobalamin-dependent protein [Planctomycetaceae bacterium]|jgi:5-methyltetrahydrofolate--homocysteine methyltransferase|nr:cobalamin-dependent protein [Planctomycetaceae bacterium]